MLIHFLGEETNGRHGGHEGGEGGVRPALPRARNQAQPPPGGEVKPLSGVRTPPGSCLFLISTSSGGLRRYQNTRYITGSATCQTIFTRISFTKK